MDQDLSAELAQLEAQLAQDDELRGQQQQQQAQNQQASVFPFAQPQQPSQPQQQQQHQQPQQQVQQAPQPQQAEQMNPFAQPFQSSAQSGQNPFMEGPFQSGSSGFTGVAHGFPSQPPSGSSAMTGASSAAAANAHSFSRDTDGRSIFVGNLPKGENGGPTTTPEELIQFFSDCGPILNCTVLKDRTTGELKGTAYIEFQSYTAMGHAIDTKNNADFKGSNLIVTKKRSNFRADRARGGRGGRGRRDGGAAMDPFQAITALMGMMNVASGGRGGYRGTYRGRGGRGGGRGAGPAGGRPSNEESSNYGSESGANASGSFQPF